MQVHTLNFIQLHSSPMLLNCDFTINTLHELYQIALIIFYYAFLSMLDVFSVMFLFPFTVTKAPNTAIPKRVIAAICITLAPFDLNINRVTLSHPSPP